MTLHDAPAHVAGTTGDHRDHPGDHPRVIAGTVLPGPFEKTAETAPDGLPGDRSGDVAVRSGAVLRTTAGAAFMAARKVSAATLWTASGAWTVLRHHVHGARATAFLAYRYVRALDLQEAMGGMTSSANVDKVKAERRARWKVIGWSAFGVFAADLVAWREIAVHTSLTALQWQAWGAAPGLEGSLVLAGLTLYGRYRLNSEVTATELLAAGDTAEDDDEPFPLSHATRAAEAEECLSRALWAEKLGARQITVRRRFEWGWEFDVLLRGTTAAKVSAAAAGIEAHMNLPNGGFSIEPDPQASAQILVRARTGNPFASMQRPILHAPNSLSIYDVVSMGRAVDGGSLDVTLDGFVALIVAAMGAGKTLGVLRTLAEAITACVDAIAWDLDPIKDGLGEFGDLMDRRGRGPQETEELLLKARDYVRARAAIFRNLGMGDRWKASRKFPALFIFVDEVTLLTDKAKEYLVDTVRSGRQVGVWVIISGQEATEDALGDAIGSIVTYRIPMACRPEDTRIMLGPGAAAAGWTPHRLLPSAGPIANDAGRSFIQGGAFNRPIVFQWNHYSIEQVASAVVERLEAGRPRMDAATRRAAGEDVTDDGREVTLPDVLDGLDHVDAPVLATVLRLFEKRDCAFLPTALLLGAVEGHSTPDGRAYDGDRLGRMLRAHAPGVAAVRQPWGGQPQVRGWLLADVERAGRGLLDPSTARLGAV